MVGKKEIHTVDQRREDQPAGIEKENLGMSIFRWPENNSVTTVGSDLRPQDSVSKGNKWK